ncbi:MAG: dephospho-CoA kinase [Bacteroides sp.]|nr:dephospho-CoA kinase [Prevotella sp.]MCM1408043.1 dephospho-CoA kinase [Treponema brennaborense]MCM1469019.1 dephospho-CoA kinase [Bacteroides sp.]
MKKRMIIAVTGSIAAGKNAAAEILEQAGFLSIDADVLARAAAEQAKDDIVRAFNAEAEQRGVSLLRPDGSLDRRVLGSIVFGSPEMLETLEKITHPLINSMMNEFIDAHPNDNIILNAAVLFKTPVISRCDCIFFIYAPALIRFFRVRRRDKLPPRQIFKRFSAQKHIFAQYKILNADMYIVKNIGSREKLRKRLFYILHIREKRG